MIPNERRPGWQYWEVSDLIRDGVLDVGDGYRAKNSEMGDSGLPFARAGSLNNGFDFEDADILNEESVRRAGDKVSKPGDVAFTSKGTFGRFARVHGDTPRFVYSPQLCYWRVKQDGVVDRGFLYYWMQGKDCMNQLNQIKGLTDMADYVSLTNQRKMWLSAPPLPIQRRIASILSAYDELIENSQRRIRVLEAMARALYLEWFVCFRFPGHEDHPRVSTSLGEVPSGWDVVRLDDIAELTKGLSYKGSGLTDHGDPMVNLKCISAGGGFRRGGVKPYSGDYRDRHGIAPGDLVIANTDLTQAGNIIGSVARVPRRGFELGGLASHHLTIVRSKGADHSYWLLCALGDSRFRDFAKGRASGTTVLGFRNDDAASYPVVLPPLSVRKSFESVLAPVVELQEKLEDRMEVLRVTRDLLLPRLLSGQLELEADRP